MSKVKVGDTVRIHYTVKNKKGKIVDTTIGKSEVTFTVGNGSVIKGLENAVVGLSEGEMITKEFSPEEAFGVINPELQQEVAKSEFPEGMKFRKGTVVMSENEDGSSLELRMFKVNKNSVVLDANHPLADQTLSYALQVVKIEN